MKDMKPKKEALKSIIKAMKSMHLKKLQGFSEADDDIPVMVAKMGEPKDIKKMMGSHNEDDEDEDEEEY